VKIEFFDSHCHFDFEDFNSERVNSQGVNLESGAGTRLAQWQECNALGVTGLLVPGVEPAQWPVAKALAADMPGLVYGVGLHPWWIMPNVPNEPLAQQAAGFLTDSRCVAIGECGLDAKIDCSMSVQLAILEQHLQLAEASRKPLIVHVRSAHNELLRCLKRYKLPEGGVVHGFSGSLQQAQDYWALGFYLGIGGTITYARAKKTRHTVAAMPLEALVLETDAPDMPPFGFQGETNHPRNIVYVAQMLAELRSESLATVAAQTWLNSQKLFGLK